MDEQDKLLQARLVQLKLLQTRIGLHGSRMWQLPLTYLGLLVLGYSRISGGSTLFPERAVYGTLSILGIVLLLCQFGAREGYLRTAENMKNLEEELGLKVSTKAPWLHIGPYFILVVVGIVLSVGMAIFAPTSSH